MPVLRPNLKVVGKAVTLSDAISKTDGVPAKVKEIMSNLKIAHGTHEVSRAMAKMNHQIARGTARDRWKSRRRKQKTAAERRERHLTKGTIKFFTGGGLSIFLYFIFHALQLRLPDDVVAAVPFAIDPVVKALWTIGLIPMFSGVGHLLAGFMVKRDPIIPLESGEPAPLRIDDAAPSDAHLDPECVRDTLFPGLTLLVCALVGLGSAPRRYQAVAVVAPAPRPAKRPTGRI